MRWKVPSKPGEVYSRIELRIIWEKATITADILKLNIQQALAQWPSPEDDWEAFTLPHSIGDGRPEFLGEGDARKIVMQFYKHRGDNSLQGHVWFSEACFGPPGHVHGGLSSYLLDEALGCATWMNDFHCVAIELTINFYRMTPVGQIHNVKARIEHVEDDLVHLHAEIFNAEEVFTSARGLFKIIEMERFLNNR